MPNDLPFRVDRKCLTEAITIQSSQITDRAFPPQSGVEQSVACSGSTTNGFPFVVEPECHRETSPERLQVREGSVIPRKRVLSARVWATHISRQIRLADHLTLIVRTLRDSDSSPERRDICHCAVLPKKRVLRRRPGSGIRSRVCGRHSRYETSTLVIAAARWERARTA